MENVLRYFFFDVLLSAGLPVAAAYIANWAVVNRFRIHDYLGDGPLCFYATTLSVVTTCGLFASKIASLTVKIAAGGTMLWVVILANVVWALAITARKRDPATAEHARASGVRRYVHLCTPSLGRERSGDPRYPSLRPLIQINPIVERGVVPLVRPCPAAALAAPRHAPGHTPPRGPAAFVEWFRSLPLQRSW